MHTCTCISYEFLVPSKTMATREWRKNGLLYSSSFAVVVVHSSVFICAFHSVRRHSFSCRRRRRMRVLKWNCINTQDENGVRTAVGWYALCGTVNSAPMHSARPSCDHLDWTAVLKWQCLVFFFFTCCCCNSCRLSSFFLVSKTWKLQQFPVTNEYTHALMQTTHHSI